MKTFGRIVLVGLGVAMAGSACRAEETIKMGVVRSLANGALLLAEKHGYFKEAGVKLDLQLLQSSATGMASLAQGQLDIIAGGVSAGYFNAIEKKLPLIITVDRATTPIRHNLMLRTDLKDKIKSLKDLKGKVIASNAPGSISTYEIGKLLESARLSFSDVEIKNIPFGQYAVAMKNKAVDAALAIPPFRYALEVNNLAIPFAESDDIIRPAPLTIAVHLVNTDWAKTRQNVLRKFYVAVTKGIREFCNAYHHGSNRQELIDLLVSSKTETRPELLNKYPWPARNLDGRLNPASVLDIQDWYLKNKFTTAKFPIEKLVDYSYTDYAQKTLGPYRLENKDDKLAGCR
ncbi:MAG: ABC transporter substrate-binding protein [Bradyrhizobium sp.]